MTTHTYNLYARTTATLFYDTESDLAPWILHNYEYLVEKFGNYAETRVGETVASEDHAYSTPVGVYVHFSITFHNKNTLNLMKIKEPELYNELQWLSKQYSTRPKTLPYVIQLDCFNNIDIDTLRELANKE